MTSTDYLWSRDPKYGVYLVADAPTRRQMSDEDRPFALAVLRAHPLRQGAMMAWNSLAQVGGFDSGLMNESCFADPVCSADALPEPIRAKLATTPSGQDRWPVGRMTLIHYLAVIAALAALAVALPRLRRLDRAAADRLMLWLALVAIAMAVNGFLGGAISEQGRYQARIVWLVPLLALVGGMRLFAAGGLAGIRASERRAAVPVAGAIH